MFSCFKHYCYYLRQEILLSVMFVGWLFRRSLVCSFVSSHLATGCTGRHRVATLLENLEKSGNWKVVRGKSGKIGKIREKSGKMNYYNYSVAAIIFQTEICNNGVFYLIKLFVRCSLIEEIAFLTCMYSYDIYLLMTWEMSAFVYIATVERVDNQ